MGDVRTHVIIRMLLRTPITESTIEILEAKEKGYDVPNQMLNNLVGYQKELSRNWRKPRDKTNRHYGYDLNQAYRLYTLALAGKPDIGAMNRLRENGNLNLPAKWRLAASYHLIGQPEAGDALLVGADHFPVRQNETYYYYGSYYRDVAMITEAAVRCGDVKKSAEVVSIQLVGRKVYFHHGLIRVN